MILESLIFFSRRFWIAVGNLNFRHTHLDLILTNQLYILEFYFYSYGIKLSKIWRIVLMKADDIRLSRQPLRLAQLLFLFFHMENLPNPPKATNLV